MIIISDPGGGHAARVPIVGVQASWSLSNIGTFSGFCRLSDLRAAGWGGDLRGAWLEWSHATAGRWGGVITGRPVADGIAEIAAEDWGGLLRGQVLDVWSRPQYGSPAGLARMAFAHVAREEPTFLTIGECQETGALSVAVTLGGQDFLGDVLPSLVDAGLEWSVDADRVLHLGVRLGQDRSSTVTIDDSREIISYQLANDTLALTPMQQVQVEAAQQALLRDHSQRRARRGWRDPRILPLRFRLHGAGLASTVAGVTPLTTPFSAQVRDVAGAWGRCLIGDTVRLVLTGVDFEGVLRIVERSLDTVGRVLSLAGEATNDPRWEAF